MYRYTYVLNNPLKYTDPSGYWKTPRWKQWWYYKTGRYAYINSRDGQKIYSHNNEENSGGGGGGGYFWFSSPFNSQDSRSSSSTEHSRDVYSHRSGGGSGFGGGVSSSSNSENESSDAIWVPPPKQQQAIDLSDPNFAAELFDYLNSNNARGSIDEIIDFSTTDEYFGEGEEYGWNLIQSIKYDAKLKGGGAVVLFDLAGDNNYNNYIKISLSNSREFSPNEMSLEEIPKDLKSSPLSTIISKKYPYIINFGFQVFNNAGTDSRTLYAISYRFTNYELFSVFYQRF